ncbi:MULTISPECIES: LysR substrate-binding domain-containing protein [Paracoccus]|uniref:LysR substrate-binding domain-containing protein n=1 Tax=Paracoccus fontiphilus TaxID=1815556 RepID=A0ABV7IIM6_9RHOB|nr:LysR substrate-binding domain-containing protein [Paracoccus fontiphilus]
MKLTHRQIEAFRAIVESGSVTAAADLLFLTQPSVSRLLADLEAELGFALFARTGRSLVPTPEANALYEEVRRSFVGLGEISRVADDIRQYRSGSLKIAAMPALGLQFLPAAIAGFVSDKPGITVSLRVRSSHAVIQHLSSQQFDMGFSALEIDLPQVRREPLGTMPMLAVLPPGHVLCDKPVLEPEDFHRQPFIALGSEISTRSDTDQFFSARKVQPRVVAEAQLSFAICAMVAAGTGVSIIEPITALHCAELGMIRIRPILPEQPFTYDILTPALGPSSRLVHDLADRVRERFEELKNSGVALNNVTTG